ncbi:MAG TPA: MerR family transcriptional regulator, partial [Steroidobacter sp.]|nr:MerR family transcriptional regulator [Steroidobacter sp.]
MREYITQAELSAVSGATTRDIENWMVRLPLRTKFKRTVQGRARDFTRDNAVEIAMVAALVRSGFTPAAAAERVSVLLKMWERGEAVGWTLFVNDDVLVLDDPPTAGQRLDLWLRTDWWLFSCLNA